MKNETASVMGAVMVGVIVFLTEGYWPSFSEILALSVIIAIYLEVKQ